ncbi:MAG: hypothetical protein GXP45_03045 [bacterium]|nr:hypothetical protein [bacterium]
MYSDDIMKISLKNIVLYASFLSLPIRVEKSILNSKEELSTLFSDQKKEYVFPIADILAQ